MAVFLQTPVAIAAAVVFLGCGSSDKSNRLSDARRLTTSRVMSFVETADTIGIRQLFTDSVLVLLPVEEMVQFRNGLIQENGMIAGLEGPFVDSSAESHFLIHFELRSLAVWLEFNMENRISFVEIANAPIPEAISDTANENTQHSHLLTTEIRKVGEFASRFDVDSSRVRLVALLSPT